MNKKGFTLIELLGVIIILALLIIIIFPSIDNTVKKSLNKTDDLTKESIYNAADLFVDNQASNFPKINGNKYIIDLKTLVEEGLLTRPIKLSGKDIDITDNKCIEVTYNKGYKYELKDSGNCEKFSKCNFQDVDKNNMYSKGDIISCNVGNSIEKFYVMENENDDATPETIDMLSMYNLYVGYTHDLKNDDKKFTLLENPTGIQNEIARGAINGEYLWYGTEKFSTTGYWRTTVNKYPAYVYNENSYLYQYVSEYENYLKENGVSTATATLISKEQLESLNCVYNGYNGNCTNAPYWVRSTTYWTGTAYDSNSVLFVYEYGNFNPDGYSYHGMSGVRPVVTISTTHIY